MTINHGNEITLSPDARFFLVPEKPLHRQYEALRAFFVDGQPSHDVARRFGYTPGAFRVLCHEFRHDPEKRTSFFQHIKRGPQSAPVRDRVRDLAVALRKKNLSVYDIQRELASAGHGISITDLLHFSSIFAMVPMYLRGFTKENTEKGQKCSAT